MMEKSVVCPFVIFESDLFAVYDNHIVSTITLKMSLLLFLISILNDYNWWFYFQLRILVCSKKFIKYGFYLN